ncbi:ferredoxin [Actinokineospora iranica]|uniref:Ferredoxin n=1 Tax=Actinokineospora iranica TaxID=1271860 RepID=A0A1G6RZS6_9PSEU|nr:ferredoxin [Actinokineospora iranica]SDD09446.1 ferredoxin [Actinokineospora iranica]
MAERARLAVDQRACVASGLCATLAPALFRLTGDGVGEPRSALVTGAAEIESAEDVAGCCPSGAVLVTPVLDGAEG